MEILKKVQAPVHLLRAQGGQPRFLNMHNAMKTRGLAEKSVAMTQKPKGLALYHDPSEANQEFKLQTTRNDCGNFVKNSDGITFTRFPVNQTMCGVFMNSCMWAVVHLSIDGVQFQRVLRNTEV